jgi:tetratricopeptide (TPR) repeat protein
LFQKDFDRAIKHLSLAVQHMPDGMGLQYAPGNMRFNLGTALFYNGNIKEGVGYLSEAVKIEPENAKYHYSLAMMLAAQGKIDESMEHYSEAVAKQPEIDTSATLHDLMGMNYSKAGRFDEAIKSAEKALELARDAGNERLARNIEERIELYKQDRPFEP